MTIDYIDAVDQNGLFDLLGKAMSLQQTVTDAFAAAAGDVAIDFEDAVASFHRLSAPDDEIMDTIAGLAPAYQGYEGAAAAFCAAVGNYCSNLLVEFVADDSGLTPRNLVDAMQYMIDQMLDEDLGVANVPVTISLAADGDNLGNPVIAYTPRRGDGQEQELSFDEVIEVKVTSDTSALSPGLLFSGERTIAAYDAAWTASGSGCRKRITATDPAASLIANGDFEDTAIQDTPDEWIVQVGTPGISLRVTQPEVQTVHLSGTPSGGSYQLRWSNPQGVIRGTDPLAYNASASAVQTALRTIPGLESVSVTSIGTTPNYTHTITFTGVAGNLSQLTSVADFTGGTNPAITHATTRIGDDGSYRGRALRIVGDGSEATTLYHPLSLDEETVYFCHCWLKRAVDEEVSSSASSSSSAGSSASSSSSTSSTSSASSSSSQWSSESSAGSSASSLGSPSSSSESSGGSSPSSSSSSQGASELRMEIVEGIGLPCTVDKAGNENGIRVDIAGISTAAHESHWFSFRLRRDTTQPAYLRMRVIGGIAAGESLYIDELAVCAGQKLYNGGPYVAAFPGDVAAVVDDKWELTVSPGLAAATSWQRNFGRVFPMRSKELLLPSAASADLDNTPLA